MSWKLPRWSVLIVLASLATLWSGAVGAEIEIGGATLSGKGEFGGRTITGDFNSAKFHEFRDPRPGTFGSLEFLLEDGDRDDYLRFWSHKIGEEDQRYEFEAGRWGIGRLRVFFGELPVAISNQARSPFDLEGDDELRLPDGFQQRVGSAADTSAALGAELFQTPPEDVEYDLRKGEVDFSMLLARGLQFEAGYDIWDRQGDRPLSLGFGSPGGSFANFAAPRDERTHEVSTALRMAREGWNLELGYRGSFFENDLRKLVVDNPLNAVDSVGLSSQGRLAVAPDNAAHNIELTGSFEIPVRFPARLTLTGGYGLRDQDDGFVDHTINSALDASQLALPENSLEAEVRTWLANAVLTAEPIESVDVKLRYRYYDFSNDTNTIEFPTHVVNDQSISTGTLIANPNSYERQNAEASVAWNIVDPLVLNLGTTWEQWQRDETRNVSRTDEHGGYAGFNLVAGPELRINAQYELGVRRRNNYKPFASLESQIPEDELTDLDRRNFQLDELRKFSQADRIQQQAGLVASWMPLENVDITFSGSWTDSNFDNTEFGLQDHQSWSAGVDVGWRPTSWLRLFGTFNQENSEYRMRARFRPRSFAPPFTIVDDVVNDWKSQSEDKVLNAGLGATIDLIPERLELEFSAHVQDSEAETRAQSVEGFTAAPPPTTSGDGGNAVDFPDIEDTLLFFQTLARLRLDEHWTLVGGYRYEKLDIKNFKLDDLDPFEPNSNVNGSGVVSPSTDLFLGHAVEDYSAHIFMLSVQLEF